MAIRVGIGGWDYDPWRGTFYPEGLAKARQLHFASRQVSAIEVNATFYKLQTPATFERWAAETPDHFTFAIKGSRFCTNRKVLADAGEAVARFCAQGFTRLGPKLGPILWQFAETKTFDPGDIAAFFRRLPREQDGLPLRHAVEARHSSFADPRFREAADRAGIAICFHDGAGGEEGLGAALGGFGYARLVRCREDEPAGYSSAELDRLAAAARAAAGDMFLFFINGAKVRAPAAATALLGRLGAEAKS